MAKNVVQTTLQNEATCGGRRGYRRHQRIGQPIVSVPDTTPDGPLGLIDDGCENEVEIISDGELPLESQPEDGELSDISDGELEANTVQSRTMSKEINASIPPTASTSRSKIKNGLNKTFTGGFTNNANSDKGERGKSKCRSTPSSPEHAHNFLHRFGRYQKTLNERTDSFNALNPIIVNKIGVAMPESCDSVGEMVADEDNKKEEDKKEEGEIDDIEDLDEDLLYLRLIALRSIAPELNADVLKDDAMGLVDDKRPDKEQGIFQNMAGQGVCEEEMVNEMEDLLNEADNAAELMVKCNQEDKDDGIEIIDKEKPVIPIIDIPDSDEEQIDLELERWTRGRNANTNTISIANIDTTASFQPMASLYHGDKHILQDCVENRVEDIQVNEKVDYSQLVQRLRQTLGRQNLERGLNKEHVQHEVIDLEKIYSPSQSPMHELVDTSIHTDTELVYPDLHTEYSPTQSPLKEVVDTPIGSEGTTPGDITPPDEETIPLKLLIPQEKQNIYNADFQLSTDINVLPPLPSGTPPPNQPTYEQQSFTKKTVGLNPSKALSLVPTWALLEKNADRTNTPPPPGEEDSLTETECNIFEKSQASLNDTVDMELGSDNEAEIQFFKDQQAQVKKDVLFPPSVWNFSNYGQAENNLIRAEGSKRSEFPYPPKMRDVMTFENHQDRYNAFLQAVVSSDSTGQPKIDIVKSRSNRKAKKRKRFTRWDEKGRNLFMLHTTNDERGSRIRNVNKCQVSLSPPRSKALRYDLKELTTGDKKETDVSIEESEEDPDQLRAQILSDMHKKKSGGSKKQVEITSNSVVTETRSELDDSTNKEKVADDSFLSSGDEENNLVKETGYTKDKANSMESSVFPENPDLNTPLQIEKKTNEVGANASNIITVNDESLKKTIEKERIMSISKTTYSAIVSELDKLSESTLSLIREIGIGRAIKSFPNLVKPVIIPYRDLENNRKPEIEKNGVISFNFAASLDNFMREARRQSNKSSHVSQKLKTKAPPKPIRKHPPVKSIPLAGKGKTSKIIHHSTKVSAISKAAKNHLMTASVKSLPLEKQEEYRRLKLLIAKKEETKKGSLKKPTLPTNASIIENSTSRETNSSPKVNEIIAQQWATDKPDNIRYGETQLEKQKLENNENSEDEAEMLRQALLSKMKDKHHSKAESKEKKNYCNVVKNAPILSNQLKRNAPRSVNTPSSIKISISNNGARNVNIEKNETSNAPNNLKRFDLVEKEEELNSIRKDVTNNLYKLSAQLSQLKSETDRKNTAEEFLSDLKIQMLETEALIARKTERINQIKAVVLQSHNQISSTRKEMIRVENQCKVLGQEVLGSVYKPPQESGHRIREKIALIQKHAKQIQPEETMSNASINETQISETRKNSSSNKIQTDLSVNNVPSDIELNDKEFTSDQMKKVQESAIAGSTKFGINSVGSALAHLRQSVQSVTIDPHKEFCRFELQGKCNDDACEFQHQFPKV